MHQFLEEDLKTICDSRIFRRCKQNGKSYNGSPCWEWQGYTDPDGYGRINIRRRKIDYCKNFYTHRLMYACYKGSIPDNKEVHHNCENRKCCNPQHLELDTRKGNMAKRWDIKKPVGIEVDKF